MCGLLAESAKNLTNRVEMVFGVAYKLFFLASLMTNVALCALFTGIMYYSHSMKKALHPAVLRCSFAFIELYLFYLEVVALSLLRRTSKLLWVGVLLSIIRTILIIFCLSMFLYADEVYTDWLVIYAQGHQVIPGLLITLSILILGVEVTVMKRFHNYNERFDISTPEIKVKGASNNSSTYNMRIALREMRRAARKKKENEERISEGSYEETPSK